MRRGMRKLQKLKARRYAAHLVDLIKYLDNLPGENISYKIFEMELNEILLNSMQNIWINQIHVQGIDCETINNKKAVNIYKHMEIAEIFYKGVV